MGWFATTAGMEEKTNFMQDQLQFLRQLATQVAIAVENCVHRLPNSGEAKRRRFRPWPAYATPNATISSMLFARPNWVVGGHAGAAARLGLKRITLVYKMRRFGIHFASGAVTNSWESVHIY